MFKLVFLTTMANAAMVPTGKSCSGANTCFPTDCCGRADYQVTLVTSTNKQTTPGYKILDICNTKTSKVYVETVPKNFVYDYKTYTNPADTNTGDQTSEPDLFRYPAATAADDKFEWAFTCYPTGAVSLATAASAMIWSSFYL